MRARLLSELVLVLPQLSGDKAVEVSRGAVVTEFSLAAGLEAERMAGQGWPGDLVPGASVWALVTLYLLGELGGMYVRPFHLSVTAQNRTSTPTASVSWHPGPHSCRVAFPGHWGPSPRSGQTTRMALLSPPRRQARPSRAGQGPVLTGRTQGT